MRCAGGAMRNRVGGDGGEKPPKDLHASHLAMHSSPFGGRNVPPQRPHGMRGVRSKKEKTLEFGLGWGVEFEAEALPSGESPSSGGSPQGPPVALDSPGGAASCKTGTEKTPLGVTAPTSGESVRPGGFPQGPPKVSDSPGGCGRTNCATKAGQKAAAKA